MENPNLTKIEIVTMDVAADVAHFQLLLFAYNIVHWFKRLCLPAEDLRKTVETLRHQFIGLPAKLSCRSGKNILVLPREYPHQKAFLAAAANVEKLKYPNTKT